LSHPAIAVVFSIFIWWFSTGAVFLLARRCEGHAWRVAFGTTAIALLALVGLYVSARMDTVAGAYIAFGSALIIWAWHEVMFLLGFIAGPRRLSATRGASGAERFREAFATVRDHELAIAATAVLVVLLTMGATNTVGLWTFVLLWVMRVSAKLSIYLGARHSLSEMMPVRQKYLTTYFRTDRTTPFLPAMIVLALAVFVWLCSLGMTADTTQTVGIALIATLLGLAIIEHVFLLLPLPDSVLWLWAAPKETDDQIKRGPAANDRTGPEQVKGGGVSWT